MQEMRIQFLDWEDSPEKGNHNTLQYSCLGNLMNRGTWWATVDGVTKKNWTWQQLNNNNSLIWKQTKMQAK